MENNERLELLETVLMEACNNDDLLVKVKNDYGFWHDVKIGDLRLMCKTRVYPPNSFASSYFRLLDIVKEYVELRKKVKENGGMD